MRETAEREIHRDKQGETEKERTKEIDIQTDRQNNSLSTEQNKF